MGMRTALSLAGALVVGLAASAVAQQHPPPAPPKAGAPDAQRTTVVQQAAVQQAGAVQQAALVQQARTVQLAALAQQAPSAQYKLNIAVGGAFTSMDPHYHNLGPNNALTSYVFEPLIRFDPKYQPQPALATSWKALDEKTWEIKLREGVTFHDGTPFTAEDVVFSFARIPTLLLSPGSFNYAVKPIVQAEVVDPYTLRLHTAAPVPLMPYNLTNVAIISKKIGAGGSRG